MRQAMLGRFRFQSQSAQKLIGLVTQKADPVGNIDPSLGVIVPSVYIKEAIDMLSGFESKTLDDR